MAGRMTRLFPCMKLLGCQIPSMNFMEAFANVELNVLLKFALAEKKVLPVQQNAMVVENALTRALNQQKKTKLPTPLKANKLLSPVFPKTNEPVQAPLLMTNKLQLVHGCLIFSLTSKIKRSARTVTGLPISICGQLSIFLRSSFHTQPTILKETGQWDIMASDGIQILNQTNTHWLCVTTIGCVQDEVSIYDSKLNKKKVHTEISQQPVPVYCKCRMPCYGKEMMAQCTQCNEWYHQKYDNILNSVFKCKNRTPFICSSCS